MNGEPIRFYGLITLALFLLILGAGIAGAIANGREVPAPVWNIMFTIVGAIAGLLPPNPSSNNGPRNGTSVRP